MHDLCGYVTTTDLYSNLATVRMQLASTNCRQYTRQWALPSLLSAPWIHTWLILNRDLFKFWKKCRSLEMSFFHFTGKPSRYIWLLQNNGKLGWRITNLCWQRWNYRLFSFFCCWWRAQFFKLLFSTKVFYFCVQLFYNLYLLSIESILETKFPQRNFAKSFCFSCLFQ